MVRSFDYGHIQILNLGNTDLNLEIGKTKNKMEPIKNRGKREERE